MTLHSTAQLVGNWLAEALVHLESKRRKENVEDTTEELTNSEAFWVQRCSAGVKSWTGGAKRDQRTTDDLRCGWRLLWKPGIFTARNRREWFVLVVYLLSWVWLFVTPWTIACQAPLSMGFSRQEYWCGLPFPALKDLSNLRIKPAYFALTSRFFTS